MRSLIVVFALFSACTTPPDDVPAAPATEAPKPPEPDPPSDPCATLACPTGSACTAGACVPTSTPAAGCTTVAGVRILPSFARSSTDVVVRDGRAYVATALGLEVYDAAVDLGATSPEPLGWVAVDGPAAGLALDGDRVAVAHGVDGVTLVDTASLAPIAHVPSGGSATGVALHGTTLFVADGTGGVALWNVADPALPVALGVVPLASGANAVLVLDGYAYVAAGHGGLAVVDLSTLDIVATRDTAGEAVRLTAAGGRLYVAAKYGGLRIFDIADAAAPVELGAYAKTNNMLIPTDAVVDAASQVAYVTEYWHALHVVDVSDPAAPVLLGMAKEHGEHTGGIALDGQRAWLASGAVQLYDLSPAVPALLGSVGAEVGYEATGAKAAGDTVYLATTQGLQVIDRATMALVGSLGTELSALAVDVAGKWAYLGLDATYPMVLAGRLAVVDVSNPAAPVLRGTANFGGRPSQVRVVDQIAYVSGGWLDAFDVSDPDAPVKVWTGPSNHSTDGLDVEGDLLAVTRRYNDLRLYDISTRESPKLLGTFDSPGQAIGVALHGAHAYLADGKRGLRVLDVTDPSAPTEVASAELPGNAFRLTASADTLWLLVDGQVRAFDVTDPLRLSPRLTLSSQGRTPTSVVLAGDSVLVTDRKVPLAEVTLGCEPAPPAAPATVGAKAPGVQWVNLVAGSTAMDVVAGDATVVTALGFAQGTAPLATPQAEVTWQEGATSLVSALPLADGTAIACGTAKAPSEVRVPAAGTPTADTARLRIVNAAAGLGAVHGVVVRGQDARDLGAPDFGEHGPAVNLAGPGRWELSIVMTGKTLLLPLPALAAGLATDAIVALSADGEPFVLLQQADGLTRQVGAPDYLARWRLVDLTQADITATLEAEPSIHAGALQASETATLWPGTKHIALSNTTTGAALGTIDALALGKDEQKSTVVFEAEDGTLDAVTIQDVWTTNDKKISHLRVLHAAKGLGAVDLYLLAYESYNDTSPKKSLLVKDADLGDLSPAVSPTVGQYGVGVDEDGDGTLEYSFWAGQFNDYGMNLLLSRDLDGRLRLGNLSPASGPVWWTYSAQQVAKVRVVNLTSRNDVNVGIPTWYEVSPQSLQAHTSTSIYPMLGGPTTLTMGTWDKSKSWSWTGTIEPEHRYSIVFWEPGDGTIVSKRVDDEEGFGVRLVHLAPATGPVAAWWSDGSDTVSLGTTAPKELSPIATSGVSNGTAGRITIDRDFDGNVDLTFDLDSAAGDFTTNAYLVEDATWPYLLVHGWSGGLSTVYAEELQARLRILYLPQGTDSLKVDVDGKSFASLWSKPGWGDVKAWFDLEGHKSLVAGDHALKVVAAGVERLLDVTLPGMSRQTLVVYGPTDDPQLMLVDDEVASEETTVTVFNAAVGTPALDVYGLSGADSTPALLAGPVTYGEWTAPVAVAAETKALALDRDGDGDPDWKSSQNIGPGPVKVFIVGTTEQPGLLLISEDGWPWLGGEALSKD